jgi:phospholipid/cholesterol/gamma-HCH transport system substrate-binding protein
MQKQAPSIGRILVAVGFALSCFGLLLFLWVAFGGPVPLKSESYRITADFPEATTLAVESDVRIGGVSVGKVKSLELAPVDERVNGQDATRVEMEIEPEFAPIAEDAGAILRLKTLLGETYVELTSGSEPSDNAAPVSLGAAANVSDAEVASVETIPEGGHLANSQVEEATQIDEIFNALDEETRESFQRWQANAAVAIQGRGLDLNDSFGNLGPFISDSSAVLTTLNRQKAALQGLVRDTGVVFQSLTARDQELAGVITNSNQTFDALASQEQALREIFQILPTFQRESRATFERLDEFQANTRPLVQDLIPVAEDLSPTLASVRELSPNLRSLFFDLDDLNRAAKRGLPATRRYFEGFGPVFDAADPSLANLNPILSYLTYYRSFIGDFFASPPAGLSNVYTELEGQPAPRHGLRQLSYLSAESLALHPVRLATNRGNGYVTPDSLDATASSSGIFKNFDCKNLDYTPASQNPDEEEHTARNPAPGLPPVGVGFAPCIIKDDFPAEFGGVRAPNLFPDP